MTTNKDNPILVVIDKEGYITAAGEPKTFTGKDLREYTTNGCDIKNMLHSEYLKLPNKWIFDKPEPQQELF